VFARSSVFDVRSVLRVFDALDAHDIFDVVDLPG
jgi:hypothetical protein